MRNKYNKISFFSISLKYVWGVLLLSFAIYCSVEGKMECHDKKNLKNWTLLFYDDADFYGYDPMLDLRRDIYVHENLNVLVLQDKFYDSAKMWIINENKEETIVKDMNEINMGCPKTLENFVHYAKFNYPAEGYIIFFYNHGVGWQGACIDNTSGNDILTMKEIENALTASGGVDLICFSGPSLMGAIESAYQLKDCTKFYIGSEDFSGYVYWKDSIKLICDIFKKNPGISHVQLAKEIIASINANAIHYGFDKCLTMSALRTDQLEPLVQAIDQLSIELINNFNQIYPEVDSLYPNVLSFGDGFSLDIYHFAEKLMESQDVHLQKLLKRIQKGVSDAVIAKCNGTSKENAHGISIYFPNTLIYNLDPQYKDSKYGLKFTSDTHWDDFLGRFIKIKLLSELSQSSIKKPVSPLEYLINTYHGISIPLKLHIE